LEPQAGEVAREGRRVWFADAVATPVCPDQLPHVAVATAAVV
jgi:hypothetical protein